MNKFIFEEELKGNLNWNEDITLIFVKIYLKQECLWNQLHPDNKIMFRRKKAHYDMIAEFKSATGISLNLYDAKKKIQSLRVSYLAQVKKMLSSDSMHEPVVFSKWFHEMDRCLKTVPGHYASQYTQRQPTVASSPKTLCETQSNNSDNITTVQRPIEVGSSHQTWIEVQSNNTEDIKVDQRPIRVASANQTWSEMQANNSEDIKITQLPTEVDTTHQIWGNLQASDSKDIKIDQLPTEMCVELQSINSEDIKMVQRPPEVGSSHQMLSELKSENLEDINTAQEAPELDSSHQMWVELPSDDSEDTSNEHLIQQNDNITHRESVIKIENHQSPMQDPTTQTEKSSKIVIKEDEFVMYGKFVASQLKKLSLDKALRLQLQIQNIVCQARLSDLSN